MKYLINIMTLLVIANFTLAEDLKKITTMDEFSQFSMEYYLNPHPELMGNAIEFIGMSGIANEPNAQASLLLSFSCMFSNYSSSRKKPWIKAIKKLDEPAKSLLNRAASESPSSILNETPISPSKNDMNWACFFATGDKIYLKNIIDVLDYVAERKDINLFLTGATAKWSLASNAMSDEIVKSEIESLKINNPKMKKIADDILTMSLGQIKDETKTIIQKQHEDGIW